MLRIVNLEEIQSALLRIPALVRALEARDPEFVANAKSWLTQAEQILSNNRLSAAAGVAALRGVVISAERGAVPPGIIVTGRPTPRKIRMATTADVIRKAEELVSNALRADIARIAEAERLVGQMVSVARQKHLIPETLNGSGHAAALRALWQAMSADPDTGSATVHVAGLVGSVDALILLDRMLPNTS